MDKNNFAEKYTPGDKKRKLSETKLKITKIKKFK
jgi:hypothetical protein